MKGVGVVYAASLLVAVLRLANALGNSNCIPYTAAQLNPAKCTETIRNNDHGDFSDLYTLLTDAKDNEDAEGFLVYSLRWMYQTIHCVSDVEAIAALFYNVPQHSLPPDTSPFWAAAYNYLHHSDSNPPIVGRRRRDDNNNLDDVLLLKKIQNITRETDPSCVQWLIGRFKASATNEFKTRNPSFPDPNNYGVAPVSSTTKTTTTTTIPTTATTKPTTTTTTTKSTTTAKTTTTPRTTKAPTTTASTTTPMTAPVPTSTTQLPTTDTTMETTPARKIRCVECMGLECLLDGDKRTECPQGEPLCMISVKEGEHGRDIKRGCASQATCDAMSTALFERCRQHVEQQLLPWHTECTFCCDRDECNVPPHIIPDVGLRSPTN